MIITVSTFFVNLKYNYALGSTGDNLLNGRFLPNLCESLLAA